MPNSHISTRNLCLKCQYFRYPAYFTSALECLLDISNLKCQSWVPALPTTNLLICSLSHFHDGSSIFLIFYIQNLGDTLDLSLPPSSQFTSNFLFLLSAEDKVPLKLLGQIMYPSCKKPIKEFPSHSGYKPASLQGYQGWCEDLIHHPDPHIYCFSHFSHHHHRMRQSVISLTQQIFLSIWSVSAIF